MITNADLDFHHHGSTEHNYAETMFLIFSVPEAGISGNAYFLGRPNAGVCLSSVYIHQGIVAHAGAADYSDAQMHVQCPEKLSDFRLSTGLAVTGSNNARDYHYRYKGTDGLCRFDLRFKGLMDPFDPLDPSQNPMLEHFGGDTEAASGAGDSWSKGHYDLVGHITGELEVHGHRFAVDCVDGLDRSWGPRAEWNSAPVSWMHMTFGTDLAFHLIMTLDIVDGQTVYTTFRFGYALVDGESCAIVAAEVDAESLSLLGMHRVVRITDAKGRKWEMVGAAVAAAPWHNAYAAFISYQTLYRWTMGDRVGFSNVTDVIGVTTLSKKLSRLANAFAVSG
ncbi:hypothetical protein BV97_04953 [Novosphingobium resinovorum]|uniref:DUF7064 domain-containing protein n=1 Tax=Novosphingobium resinovorum TaxID=158500 RepID=A0A031JGJ7_9SPHN|nr:hypothetical protein [Novosphingobium resinovorum]EZP73199.1 hypothetical protein BV97_04953 [Novosphingobium resinovorum]